MNQRNSAFAAALAAGLTATAVAAFGAAAANAQTSASPSPAAARSASKMTKTTKTAHHAATSAGAGTSSDATSAVIRSQNAIQRSAAYNTGSALGDNSGTNHLTTRTNAQQGAGQTSRRTDAGANGMGGRAANGVGKSMSAAHGSTSSTKTTRTPWAGGKVTSSDTAHGQTTAQTGSAVIPVGSTSATTK